jgi:GxxExxY protein
LESERINQLSNKIIGHVIKVHKALGPGFIEKIYSKALAYELEKSKIKFSREKPVRVKYEGLLLGEHRLDFLIEDEIILEVKAVAEINNFHMAQALSYLKAIGRKLCLLLNFSQAKLEIKRVVFNL